MGKKVKSTAKTKSYIDSSAFIAFFDRSDTYHPIFARLFSNPPQLITSPLVISETHAWFLKRYDTGRALQFLGFLEQFSSLSIVSIAEKDLKAAIRYIRKFVDQPLTLVDAMGLYLMERLHVGTCWSTDRHLGLTGVRLVIHYG